jgi:hypothetical protein
MKSQLKSPLKSPLKSQLIPVGDLSLVDREAMYTLLNRHFVGVRSDVFGADLRQKNWVLLLRDGESGELWGFTTFLIYQVQFGGELLNIVYSGDTIVDPNAWGSSMLPKAWLGAINQLRQDYPEGRFYWLLICSGYRTYRFLPVFAKTFYPRYDEVTPERDAALIQMLAAERFGELYNPMTGVVQLLHPQQLREGLSGIPEGRLSDPHIQFFAQHNPGADAGDELVCLTEVCEENLTSAGRRIWSATAKMTTLAGV